MVNQRGKCGLARKMFAGVSTLNCGGQVSGRGPLGNSVAAGPSCRWWGASLRHGWPGVKVGLSTQFNEQERSS